MTCVQKVHISIGESYIRPIILYPSNKYFFKFNFKAITYERPLKQFKKSSSTIDNMRWLTKYCRWCQLNFFFHYQKKKEKYFFGVFNFPPCAENYSFFKRPNIAKWCQLSSLFRFPLFGNQFWRFLTPI